jgi:hypothetical protein
MRLVCRKCSADMVEVEPLKAVIVQLHCGMCGEDQSVSFPTPEKPSVPDATGDSTPVT